MAAPLAIVFALTIAACGSDNNNTSSATTAPEQAKINCSEAAAINGAGSTFVATIVQQWTKDYQTACPGTTINYAGGGSGAGVQQFTAGTADFAGTDVPLTSAEMTAAEGKYGSGNVVELPWAAGGIAIEYNLNGVTNLKLSGDTLAQIFAGKVTKWNDAAIASDNSGVTLPSTAIQVIHRSESSGTTAAFASYLTAADPIDWTYGSTKATSFPVGQGEKGSDGVTATVKQTDGSIGYAEVSYAQANSLSVAAIKNNAGSFVKATDSGAVSAALATAKVNTDGTVTLDYKSSDAKAYPISTVSYVLAAKPASANAKTNLVQSYIEYALGRGQSSATGLGYAPLSTALVNGAQTKADGLASSSAAVTTTTR